MTIKARPLDIRGHYENAMSLYYKASLVSCIAEPSMKCASKYIRDHGLETYGCLSFVTLLFLHDRPGSFIDPRQCTTHQYKTRHRYILGINMEFIMMQVYHLGL